MDNGPVAIQAPWPNGTLLHGDGMDRPLHVGCRAQSLEAGHGAEVRVERQTLMHLCASVYRAVEHVSASATLADPSLLAWVDPSALVPWLQVATLSVGFITGLGSAGLVFLKYLQRWRGRTSRD